MVINCYKLYHPYGRTYDYSVMTCRGKPPKMINSNFVFMKIVSCSFAIESTINFNFIFLKPHQLNDMLEEHHQCFKTFIVIFVQLKLSDEIPQY